eukprot:4010981-Prymnesium_polylepis.1
MADALGRQPIALVTRAGGDFRARCAATRPGVAHCRRAQRDRGFRRASCMCNPLPGHVVADIVRFVHLRRSSSSSSMRRHPSRAHPTRSAPHASSHALVSTQACGRAPSRALTSPISGMRVLPTESRAGVSLVASRPYPVTDEHSGAVGKLFGVDGGSNLFRHVATASAVAHDRTLSVQTGCKLTRRVWTQHE